MASINLSFDFSDFEKKSREVLSKFDRQRARATMSVADEILRLSQKEVPHDIGSLQNTGHTQQSGADTLVGYNTRYAARLHEHPEYNFQKNRKGKYLEDPIKNNMNFFLKVLGGKYQELL